MTDWFTLVVILILVAFGFYIFYKMAERGYNDALRKHEQHG